MFVKNTLYLLKTISIFFFFNFAFIGCEIEETNPDAMEIIEEDDDDPMDDPDPIDPNLFTRTDSGFRLQQLIQTSYRLDGTIISRLHRGFEYNTDAQVTRSFNQANNNTYNDYGYIVTNNSSRYTVRIFPFEEPSRNSVSLSLDLSGKVRVRREVASTFDSTLDYEYEEGLMQRSRFDDSASGSRLNLTFSQANGEIIEARNGRCQFNDNFCEDLGEHKKWYYSNVSGYQPSRWLYSVDSNFGRDPYSTNLHEVPLASLPTSSEAFRDGDQQLVQITNFTYEFDGQNRVTKRRETYFLPDGTPFEYYVDYEFVW